MKLYELIEHFKNLPKAQILAEQELPGVYSDQIDIYLENKLAIDSEVRFFDAEEIPNKLVIVVDGKQYVNLFPFSMTQEMVEGYWNFTDQNLSNTEICQRLLEYREKDA